MKPVSKSKKYKVIAHIHYFLFVGTFAFGFLAEDYAILAASAVAYLCYMILEISADVMEELEK